MSQSPWVAGGVLVPLAVGRILVIDGSGADAMAALLDGDQDGLHLLAERRAEGRGGGERLALLVRDLLAGAGWSAGSLALIAAVTGPGSFTGLRASLSLAQGLALGSLAMGDNAALHGVGWAEALRASVTAPEDDWPLWCAGLARRDRVFLQRDQDGILEAFMLDGLPPPPGPVRLAGDGAPLVADRLADAVQTGVTRCTAPAIAAIACERMAQHRPAMAALPIYVDPVQAALPAAGLRPMPQ